MVLKPEPLFAAVEALRTPRARVILMDPRGRAFTQAVVRELAAESHLILLAGRYEGVDERVSERLADDAISIGDYVLTGGELPALVIADAVTRLLPGALGAEGAAERESFASGLLEPPQYTRPEEFQGARVPAVLLALAGCTSPEAAQALAGRLIAIPEGEALPPRAGTFYPWQLEGALVMTEDGREVGRMAGIEQGAAQDLWVVRDGGREHLIPAVAEIVVDVDVAARRVVIRPPDGLLEL